MQKTETLPPYPFYFLLDILANLVTQQISTEIDGNPSIDGKLRALVHMHNLLIVVSGRREAIHSMLPLSLLFTTLGADREDAQKKIFLYTSLIKKKTSIDLDIKCKTLSSPSCTDIIKRNGQHIPY